MMKASTRPFSITMSLLAAPPIVTAEAGPLAGRIVVAQGGYNCTNNYFAKIEADFRHEVILRCIGQEIVSGDGTDGSVIPVETKPPGFKQAARLLGKKSANGFWADRKLYNLWDGTPQYFNSD
jgi:hypothetical protein